MLNGSPFETNGDDYLKTLTVQEAAYDSSAAKQVIQIPSQS
jgi:hypothetical protein